jgi:PAS domain S-box-containing protein
VNRAEYERVLEDVPGLTFTFAADGTTEFISRRLLTYMGRSLEQLRNWAFDDTMHPDDFDRLTREWRANTAARRAYAMEHRLRRADGVYRWVQVNVAPRHDADGNLIGWCGLVIDLGDAKR